jgi:tetraacyldisaccharide 4'-kinase
MPADDRRALLPFGLMRAPAFWWQTPPTPLARALAPFGSLWGNLAARRMSKRGGAAPLPVICVGNFTAGGAGKTPTALALADLLCADGERPAFLSRGYGGREAGPLLVDVARLGAGDVGDEPLLLARSAPTIVARDRPGGAALAAGTGATVIVMDDGLQNPSLLKSLGLAVVDGATGIGNGLTLPAGPLRAPLSAQWPRTDAVVVIGKGEPGDRIAGEAATRGKPVLRASLEADPAAAARLKGERVLAFAGIGRPAKFFESLAACGAIVVGARAFGDHHAYTAAEIARLAAEARAGGLALVTTEKDRVRLEGLRVPLAAFLTLPVRLAFEDVEGVRTLLRKALGRYRPPVSG